MSKKKHQPSLPQHGGKSKTGNYSSKASCHTGCLEVFAFTNDKGEKVRVTAGGTSRNGHWHQTDILPSVVIGPDSLIHPLYFPPGWLIARTMPSFVGLDFPDRGTPKRLYTGFWDDLASDLKKYSYGKVHCMCMGGHGRTGLLLAILYHKLVAHKRKSVDDIVKYLREKYCDHIVEADCQFEYIAAITGLPWLKEVEASDTWTSSYTNSYTSQILASQNNFWGRFDAAAKVWGGFKNVPQYNNPEYEAFREWWNNTVSAFSQNAPQGEFAGFEKDKFFIQTHDEKSGKLHYTTYSTWDLFREAIQKAHDKLMGKGSGASSGDDTDKALPSKSLIKSLPPPKNMSEKMDAATTDDDVEVMDEEEDFSTALEAMAVEDRRELLREMMDYGIDITDYIGDDPAIVNEFLGALKGGKP